MLPRYKDEKWLREQYVNKERTLKNIGIECGVSWGCISYWCKKFSIPQRDPRDPEFMRKIQKIASENRTKHFCKEWIRERYEDKGMTLEEIAEEAGCSWETIGRRCEYFGIPFRKRIERPWVVKQRQIQKETFSDVKQLRGVMVEIFGYKCMYPECNYDKFIELHHLEGNNIREVKKGKIIGRKHTNNSMKNSILLCPNHHKEADYKLISDEIIEEMCKKRDKIIKDIVRHPQQWGINNG